MASRAGRDGVAYCRRRRSLRPRRRGRRDHAPRGGNDGGRTPPPPAFGRSPSPASGGGWRASGIHAANRKSIYARMTPLSVLRIVRWLVLALALLASARISAADSTPLDLDATRTALTAIDSALKDQNLTDADLQRLRAENDPLGIALQAAIADMTPRLAASVKRLAELTPKSKETAPATDAATAELASEKQKHDALDGNLRAARAMLLQADDNATRIGARRRELFARETFARSSSVFNPQLWLSVWREAPTDLRVMTSLIGGWLAAVGARLTVTKILGMVGVIVLLALVSGPVLWIARR